LISQTHALIDSEKAHIANSRVLIEASKSDLLPKTKNGPEAGSR
jgi:hypothetical protein